MGSLPVCLHITAKLLDPFKLSMLGTVTMSGRASKDGRTLMIQVVKGSGEFEIVPSPHLPVAIGICDFSYSHLHSAL